MDNFEYVVPTRLIAGKEKENQVCRWNVRLFFKEVLNKRGLDYHWHWNK